MKWLKRITSFSAMNLTTTPTYLTRTNRLIHLKHFPPHHPPRHRPLAPAVSHRTRGRRTQTQNPQPTKAKRMWLWSKITPHHPPRNAGAPLKIRFPHRLRSVRYDLQGILYQTQGEW